MSHPFKFTATFLFVSMFALAQNGQTLQGHVPVDVYSAVRADRLAANSRLELIISLPLRNQAELDARLQSVTDPSSPTYRNYLTPEQFTAEFGPTQSDYEKVIAFAQAKGLRVVGTHTNRMLINVEGTVAAIESTLHVNLYNYQRSNGTSFYAPDSDPSVDLDVPLLEIKGLDNSAPPRPASLHVSAVPSVGSGSGGCYEGKDFRAAYAPGVTLTGAGQTIALLELSDYWDGDPQTYESQNGLSVPVTRKVAGTNPGFPMCPPTSNSLCEIEDALDIEVAAAMAPGASDILVYVGSNPDTILSQIAEDNIAKQISSSWSWRGPDATANNIFQEFAQQGQSFYEASGDNNNYDGLQGFYENDSVYVTSVGGTELLTTGPAGSWLSEVAWGNDDINGKIVGSSGGISTLTLIPSWQQGISMAANGGSTTMRNIPDVSMVALGPCTISDDGLAQPVYGTSIAAPLWAGFTTMVNQLAAQQGKASLGFANPSIYAIGKGANYQSDFNDITSGCNAIECAVAGYDLVTGWGSPTGQSLIYDLSGATPIASLLVKGPSGQTTVTSSPYVFGDMYTFTITGHPNRSVTVDTVVNGADGGMSASLGKTNAVGVFQSSAEFTPAWGYVAGTYKETWYVGNTAAPPISFTLVQ